MYLLAIITTEAAVTNHAQLGSTQWAASETTTTLYTLQSYDIKHQYCGQYRRYSSDKERQFVTAIDAISIRCIETKKKRFGN